MNSREQMSNEEETDWKALLDCPLCLQTLSSPVATTCGHIFCADCLGKALLTAELCPLCRAPCYLQPNLTINKKPLVLVERLIELAFGNKSKEARTSIRSQSSHNEGAFRIPLFLLNEPGFSEVPGHKFQFRAWEPYVIALVRRCVLNSIRMGIQPTVRSKHGLIVRVDTVSPLRRHSNHWLVDCTVEGLYRTVSEPQAEPDTSGLYTVMAEMIQSDVGVDSPEATELVQRARYSFEQAIKQLDPAESTAIFEDPFVGSMRVLPSDPVDLSFFLIDAIQFPGNAQDAILYEPDVRKRLGFCIEELRKPDPQFKRVNGLRILSGSRDRLDRSRNILMASGLMIFFGVVFGGLESVSPFFRRH